MRVVCPRAVRLRGAGLILVIILLGPTVPAVASLGATGPGGPFTDHGDDERGGDTYVAVGPEAPWWARWDRDLDGDRIDDTLTRVAAEGVTAAYTTSGLRMVSHARTDHGVRFDVFVRYDHVPDADERRSVEAAVAPLGAEVRLFRFAEALHVQDVPYETVEALADLPGVRGVEADRTVYPFLDLASKSTLVSSSLELGNGARARWVVAGRDQGVAVLDTGIDDEHPAFGLGDRYLGGYDATAWAAPPGPLARTNPDSDDLATHGTHVAGIAVGLDPDRRHIGIAPEAGFLDVKVMAREVGVGPLVLGPSSFGTEHLVAGTGSSIITGMEFVARYNDDATYLGNNTSARPITVVVMSFGETTPDENGTSALSHAVDRFVEETGIVVVAAAGNCGPEARQGVVLEPCTDIGDGTVPAPGAAARAITVGAMDDRETLTWGDDVISGISSRGGNGGEPKPNLVAYGVKIAAPKGDPRMGETQDENAYQNLTGTSMATPMVAGIVALMRESRPSITVDEIKALLEETARPVGPEGWDPLHGWGIVNAYAAVGRANGNLSQAEVDAEYERLAGDVFGAGDHADHDHEHGDDARRTRDEGKGEPPKAPSRPPPNRPPEARFRAEPLEFVLGGSVRVYDESTDPDGDPIVSRVWDFGDGTTARGEALEHKYGRAGTYTVRLTVTDSNGTHHRTATTEKVVTVLPVETEESPASPLLPVLGLAALAMWAARRPPVRCVPRRT